MTVTQEQFESMVEDMTVDLICLVMERKGLSMSDAFHQVYTSPIYEVLRNPDSQLYYQSPGYVYSCMLDYMQSN